MLLYRIAKRKSRANDLSGQGAANEGGRWNSEGVFALYTSQSRALAMLELLVHVDEVDLPPHLFLMTIEVADSADFYEVADADLPDDWRQPGNFRLQQMGDMVFSKREFIGLKARSAVMPPEYNYVLNPLFARFYDLVKVIHTEEYAPDQRL